MKMTNEKEIVKGTQDKKKDIHMYAEKEWLASEENSYSEEEHEQNKKEDLFVNWRTGEYILGSIVVSGKENHAEIFLSHVENCSPSEIYEKYGEVYFDGYGNICFQTKNGGDEEIIQMNEEELSDFENEFGYRPVMQE